MNNFIKLTTEISLDRIDIKKWLEICNDVTNNGIKSVKIKRNNKIKKTKIIHHSSNGKHEYILFINDELSTVMGDILADKWSFYWNKGDFEIETNTSSISEEIDMVLPLDLDLSQYDSLCEMLSKHLHYKWYLDRSNKGWRYGLIMNESEKTHPMLRPWEELPAAYRTIDYELPKIMLKFLEDLDYVMIHKKDLE